MVGMGTTGEGYKNSAEEGEDGSEEGEEGILEDDAFNRTKGEDPGEGVAGREEVEEDRLLEDRDEEN